MNQPTRRLAAPTTSRGDAPNRAELSRHLNKLSLVDEHDRDRGGPSLGGLLGGSLVRETPSEPPPSNHPKAQVSPPARPTRDRAD